MEEKDGGLRFFRAVIRRDEEHYDMISAYWGLEDQTMAMLRNRGFDTSKIRKFLIVKDYCKVFGLVTTLQDLTEKDINIQYLLYKNGSTNIDVDVEENTLEFKEWNYSKFDGNFEKDVIEFTTRRIFENRFLESNTLFTCIFNAFSIFDGWSITCPKQLTKKEKEIMASILKAESSYGRKREKT